MNAAIQQQLEESPPPHSVEAEQSVIGSLLLDAKAWSDVSPELTAQDFYRPDHRAIYAAIGTRARAGQGFDVVLVAEQLEHSGELDQVGGLAYLSKVARITPSAANVRHYADIVLERARLRRLQSVGHNIEQAIADGATSLQIAQSLRPVLETFSEAAGAPTKRLPLDWSALEHRTPPERDWAEEPWLGMGHVTLLAGGGGTGKTTAAQAWGSCLALRREYLGWPPAARRVLMWATEDDTEELWRKQVSIANYLKVQLSDFKDRLFLHSYEGEQVELAAMLDQRTLVGTRSLQMLREQIGDYKAEVVILDNIARLYAGNENDRHQVTSFVAMLTAAALPTRAAVLLLGHPGKAQGSEYSGSTAWEGAVRARLYLGRKLPDQAQADEEPPEDDTIRYLCRRKANYSNSDWRRLQYRDGVMVPEAAPADRSGNARPTAEYARDCVARAVRKLVEMKEYGSASTASVNYLPKLATRFKLLDRLTEKQFAAAMREMQADQTLVKDIVGSYDNRHKREGLVLRVSPGPGG